jgi:hypothetical protein
MLFEKMAEMISRAPIAALDDVTRALWAAVSAAQLDEAQALRLSEAIDARRMHSKGVQAAAGRGLLPARVAPPRKHQRPPERSEARERSRRWAAAGRMPPAIACKFTQGEQAALAVITVEMTKRQTCTMAIGAIAALAGVSESTVKRAIRQARALGFLTVQERRLSRYRNDTNIVRIISKAWLSWLELRGSGGGVQTRPGTNTRGFRKERRLTREACASLDSAQSSGGKYVDRGTPGTRSENRRA